MKNRNISEPFRFPAIPNGPSLAERFRAAARQARGGLKRKAVLTTFIVGVATIAFCHYALAIG